MSKFSAGTKLAAGGFAALVLATLGAFFITQHLKVSDPLIAGVEIKPTWINPAGGRVCRMAGHQTDFSTAEIRFFLPDHNDTVMVSIVNSRDRTVRRLAQRYLRQGQRAKFIWNGREADGSTAPDGTYNVNVTLRRERRTFEISDTPIHVDTRTPTIKLYPVTVSAAGATKPATTATTTTTTAASRSPSVRAAATVAGATVITPGRTVARISFLAGATRGGSILIYRASAAGKLTLVGSYGLLRNQQSAIWNGKIKGKPAPPGAYLLGVQVFDYACNVGQFPRRTPSGLESTAGAGVTVSYLSLVTPTTPLTAGTATRIVVNSDGAAYGWTLRAAGSGKVEAHGQVPAGQGTRLDLAVPASASGLDVLTVSSGTHSESAPLLVNGTSQPVLVVVPALTWQGENAVDSTGDGIPDTLTGGDWVGLSRPLIAGLPTGFADTAALLEHLTAEGLNYTLTSDLALAQGSGPQLTGHSGVLLAGTFRWLPAAFATALRTYAKDGGRVVQVGAGSLMATARLKSTSGGELAGDPTATSTDPFGLGRGPLATAQGETFSVLSDPLSLFTGLSEGSSTSNGSSTASGSSGSELSGLSAAQQLVIPTADSDEVSLIGAASGKPVGAAFDFGSGKVIELAVSGFGHSLASSAGSRNLLDGLWKLLEG